MIDAEFEARMLAVASMTTADEVVGFYLRIGMGIWIGMMFVGGLMSWLVGRRKG